MRILPIILCMLCGLISKESYAACSDAAGKATINEVYKLTTGGGTASFVEIKIIDETLTSAVYDEWTLQVCYEPSNNNLDCKSYNVSDFIDNFPWLYIQAPTFEDKYLDFKKGFDITLRGDAADNDGADSQEVIDYVVTKNFFEQDLASCSTDDLPYWFGSQNTNNGTKLAKRISDGTGGWEIVNSNDESETPGASNDGPTIDHYEIIHDGSGLTCEAENITIKACADASCSTLINDATDVQLSINGTFDKTVTVSGGSTDTSFSYTNVGTATLSLDQTYECKNGGSTSCDVVFADAGFRFLYGAAESTTIGNQISGNDFTDIVKLQAVENVDGVCSGLFTGSVDVELSQRNIDPVGTSGLSFKVNGASGTSIDKFPTYSADIQLNFGADSKAIITDPVYLDAGQIRLQAKYDVGGVSLVGSSNDFWVSPFKLVASAQSGGSDINGNTDSSTTIHKAGQAFDFTVTAVNSLGNTTINYSDNRWVNDQG